MLRGQGIGAHKRGDPIPPIVGGGGEEPPPGGFTGPLTWRPPLWDGSGDPRAISSYPVSVQERTMPQTKGELLLDNNTDYLVHLGHPEWNSQGFDRSVLSIRGGRHVVMIGGRITAHSNDPLDDMLALQINDGNPLGIVHIEGVLIDPCPNLFTIRTPRIVQIQNCRGVAQTYQDDYNSGGNHPDIVQWWDSAAGSQTRIDRLSAWSSFTGFSVVTFSASTSPNRITIRNSDIHSLPGQPGGLSAPASRGAPLIMGACAYYGDYHVTTWDVDNVWLEPGYYSASHRWKLDEVCFFPAAPYASYELTPGPLQSGTKYLSPFPGTSANTGFGGTTPLDLGRRQGDFMTHERETSLLPLVKWTWGVATEADGADSNGNFCDSTVGESYVPVGYV